MRARALTAALVLGLGVVGLAACGSDQTGASSTSVAAQPVLEVTDAWCRTSPSMTSTGACYVTIANVGGADDALVSASVPASVAGTVQLHETVAAAGTDTGGSGAMTMREVPQVPLPSGQTVTFGPGGLHIMLLDLAAPLVQGSMVELSFDFQVSSPQTVGAEVRSG